MSSGNILAGFTRLASWPGVACRASRFTHDFSDLGFVSGISTPEPCTRA